MRQNKTTNLTLDKRHSGKGAISEALRLPTVMPGGNLQASV